MNKHIHLRIESLPRILKLFKVSLALKFRMGARMLLLYKETVLEGKVQNDNLVHPFLLENLENKTLKFVYSICLKHTFSAHKVGSADYKITS